MVDIGSVSITINGLLGVIEKWTCREMMVMRLSISFARKT